MPIGSWSVLIGDRGNGVILTDAALEKEGLLRSRSRIELPVDASLAMAVSLSVVAAFFLDDIGSADTAFLVRARLDRLPTKTGWFVV